MAKIDVDKIQNGTKLRVKSTKLLREFGIRCGGAWVNEADKKVWPKEVGVVEEYEGNGWKGLKISFSRGRTIQLGTLYSDSENWEFDVDKLEDFVIVKD